MNNDPRSHVDRAIRETISAINPGDLVTGWVLMTSTLAPGDDGTYRYRWLTCEGQQLHASFGLVKILERDLHVALDNGARGAG